MRDEYITLFGSQPSLKKYGPREYGPVAGCLVFLPSLLLAAVLSLPFGFVWKLAMDFKEWRLARRMTKQHRVITWNEFVQAVDENRGTMIWERDHSKAPDRYWWTADDVYAQTPFPCGDHFSMWFFGEFLPFRKWAFEKYTSPHTGGALLVLDKADRKQLKETIKTFPFIEMVPPRKPPRERFKA